MLLEFWSFLTAWYNLPFTVLLGLGLVVAALQLIGLGGDDDSDADLHGGDVDHDVDVDHGVDHADHDADGDGDQDGDHEGDGEGDNFSLLSFIGVGKVPMLVVFLILFVTVGLLGWLLNGVIQSVIGSFPGLLILLTLPVATVSGAVFTSRVTRLIGNLVPPLTTTASRAEALVGMTGTVTSPYVDHVYGQVHLRDLGSTLISVFAITEDGEAIPRGEKVLLVSYDAAGRRFHVTRK